MIYGFCFINHIDGMAMKRVIRLGDPTDHGGFVTGAAPTTTFFGKPVARLGDPVSCPQQGHTGCVIVEGDPSWIIDGKATALEGHKVSCGATLISTLGEVGRSYEASGAASVGGTARAVVLVATAAAAALENEIIEHWYTLEDESGHPVEGYRYDLYQNKERVTHKGSFNSGKTNAIQGGDSDFVMWLERDSAKRD